MAARIYQFPTQHKNGNYTEAYIDWQYKSFYDEEEENLRLNPNYYKEDYPETNNEIIQEIYELETNYSSCEEFDKLWSKE